MGGAGGLAGGGGGAAGVGSLGAVIVFLTWLYLTAYIVLLGAEMNAILELSVGRDKVAEGEAGAARPIPVEPRRPARPAAAPAEPATPSLPQLAARLGLFSILLTLLGRPRRPAVSRSAPLRTAR